MEFHWRNQPVVPNSFWATSGAAKPVNTTSFVALQTFSSEGKCHEIFRLWFHSSNNFSWSQLEFLEMVSNFLNIRGVILSRIGLL
jgi:hypothetical protein